MVGSAETERVRRYYETSADEYDGYVDYFERVLFAADHRRWICAQAEGDVLEIGIGTGRNIPYYPDHVRLTGIDLTPAMLEVARRRAAALGRDVDLRLGDAQGLDLSDGRFDTAVATLVLCAIPDDRRAVAEVFRVLRPGGRFLLVEHVRSSLLPVRAIQRLLNPFFVRRHADHLLRDPLDHLAPAGFVVERVERSRWGIIERVTARKPSAPAVAG